MFGAYRVEKLYRLGGTAALRILALDAGAFLLQSHIQNLPQQLGGNVGGPNYLRTRDDASGAQNVIWGMPRISNEPFPGLAYYVGGDHSSGQVGLHRLTAADFANWPYDAVAFLKCTSGPAYTANEIDTATTTDFITKTALYNALLGAITGARFLWTELSRSARRRVPCRARLRIPACSPSTSSAARRSS